MSSSILEKLRAENAELRARLQEADEALNAIPRGTSGAIPEKAEAGPKVYNPTRFDTETHRFHGEILAQISDVVIATDLEQYITYFNAAAERQYLVRSKDALGRRLDEIYTRRWPHAEAERAAWAALQECGEWRGETIQVTNDGRELHIEASVTTLRDPDGTAIGLLGIFRDVTARKRAEAEKRQALVLLDTLMRTAPVGLTFIDRELRFLRINDRLAEMNGVPVEAHIGRTFSEIVPSLSETVLAMTRQIIATGEAVLNIEVSIETAAAPGLTRYWESSWYPVSDGEGSIIGFGAVVEEITDRQNARREIEKLLRLIETSKDFIGTTDLEGRLTYLNSAGRQMIGIEPSDDIRQYWMSDIVPETLRGFLQDVVTSTREEGNWEGEMQFRNIRTGALIDVDRHIFLICDPENGEAWCFASVTRDITRGKQAAAELRASQKRLQLATEAAELGVWLWEPASESVVWENDWPYRLLGLPFTEAPVTAARFMAEFVHPEDLVAFEQAISATVQRGEPFRFRGRFRRPDGELRWIEFTGKPDFEDDGVCRQVIGTVKDVTQRERTAQALRQSREDLNRAQAVGQIGSWRLDVGRNALFWSDENYRIFGIPKGTPLTYETFLGTVHPGDRQYVDEQWDRAMLGAPYDIEHRILVDGQVKWVREKAYLEFDADNALLGGFGITQDITQRKRVEDDLRQSEALYRGIGESMDYGVWVCSPEGKNTYASPSFLGMVGITQEQCSDFGWGDVLHPDDAAATIAAWQECVRTGSFWEREHRFRSKDGDWRHVLARGVPVRDEQGNLTCWAGINLDITALKQAQETLRASEQRMRLATETTGVGIWEWNVITNKIRWDAAMFRIYGMAPTEDGLIEYKTWSERVLPEDLPGQEEILQNTARRQGRSTRQFRIRRFSDQQCRYIESVESVREDPHGRAEWVVGTNFDVTERKQYEEKLREADRRKDEFLAMLGHELRNPLTPIQSVAQLLTSQTLDQSTLIWAGEVLNRNTAQLARLIDDLLDVSRITRGLVTLRRERIELAGLIQESVEAVRSLCQKKRQTLHVDWPHQSHYLDGDPIRITQVFTNLLHNAVKYTAEGGRIDLSVKRDDLNTWVRIKDSGMGISPELIPHIFDLFVQNERGLDRSEGGLGIGLTLVKKLVELHGGQVAASSEGPNQGAEFTVRLPALDAAALSSVESNCQNASAALGSQGLKILLIDDDPDVGDSLALLLRVLGHEVMIAHDGPSGLSVAKGFSPDVILLDIGLPGMDGFEVARLLREQSGSGDRLILAVSGYAHNQLESRAESAVFDHYLLKPPDFGKLRDLLADYWRSRQDTALVQKSS